VTIKSPHLRKPVQATPDNIAGVIASLQQQRTVIDSPFLAVTTYKFTSRRSPRRKDFSWSNQKGSIEQHYHWTREDLSAAEVIEVFRDLKRSNALAISGSGERDERKSRHTVKRDG
jgi:hypothetical protein